MEYDINDLWWKDKFEMVEGHIYWYYYNEDGNDGDGQVVEVCIYPYNVLLNADEDEFWDHLSETCVTYLHDSDDEDFNCYLEILLENKGNSNTYHSNSTPDTMEWIVEWAKEYV